MGAAEGLPVPPGLPVTDPAHHLRRIFSADESALDSCWAAYTAGKVHPSIRMYPCSRKR